MFARGRCVFVSLLTMFVRRSSVLLRIFVLPDIVMMGRLMMMVRRGVVMSSCLVVMLTRRMLH
jgi:hypothetical protein